MRPINALPTVPPRPADSHKGSYGHVLVIAGSEGMIGAGCLCASGAQRCGSGLVTLAVGRSLLDVAAAKVTSCLTMPLAETDARSPSAEALKAILAVCDKFDVIALGPGIGRHPITEALVRDLVEQVTLPMVIDADGLNALADDTDAIRRRRAPAVLTPHPGEMARLTGSTTADVQKDRTNVAAAFAREHGCVVALKGHGTVVTDGERCYVNGTGNPGMATGGTGDVLTGAVASFLGQDFEAFGAAQLGVYIHGLAGDIARDRVGEISLIAEDVLDALPEAFVRFTGRSNE